ncbi:MAG: Type 1 glutamine amidotransferase-like domain-containing protein [Chloroflexi bacterium]|nr:Type 1 glutamine amidotransferase-like domain-containing protein [Chloroflexota bacterium]
MSGTLALVGAGEFLDTMNDVDRELLARAGGSKVAVLPTASAPDGPGVPERWANMGVEHFDRLGAQTDAVMALDRAQCQDPALAERVATCNLVYFSGGKPDYLYDTLVDTPVWAAVAGVLRRGGVVAGCSAGAMIMGAFLPVFSRRMGVPSIGRWQAAFDLVPHAVIAPHYNEFPELFSGVMFGGRPPGTFLIGVDAGTALVGLDGSWQVMGSRRVTVRRDSSTERFTEGQSVRL